MNCTLSPISVNALVFSGGDVWNEDEPDAPPNAILQSLAQSVPGLSNTERPNEALPLDAEQNVSTYVRVFEDMIGTIIKEEAHLLNDEEFALLTIFAHLSYNARFLMVKLLMRRQETWHRVDNLKYESELGSVKAIVDAIDELCQAGLPFDGVKKKPKEAVINLAIDSESVANPQQAEEQIKSAFVDIGTLSGDRPLALARSDQEMDLESLLECMRVNELKAVAKGLKLNTRYKKDDLIKDLLRGSSSQSTLTSFACNKDGAASSKGHIYRQTKLSFGKLKPQQDRLRDIVLKHLTRCVRVDKVFFGVIHRVNLVYFRITQYTPSILVAALLTRFSKRAYPGYKFERTSDIWPTRQALLDYEEVLILEGKIDALFSGNVPLQGGRMTEKTPVNGCFPTRGSANGRGKDLRDEDMKQNVKPDNARLRSARMVKEIFEQVYPQWQDLMSVNDDEDGRANGLQRFHYGHVLTRIICKGSNALNILKEYQGELDVLEALLAQKRWRRGRRGGWHNRRALILSTHFGKDEESLERALDAVIEGLEDPDTHIVFRLKLQRRLKRLENKLKIPAKERHICEGVLADANEVIMVAIRLRHRAASLKLDRTGRCVEATASPLVNQDIKRYYSPVITPMKREQSPSAAPPSSRKSPSGTPKGKSLWLGRNDEELTVEYLALQRYEVQGFKGVHCETRIIAMLFSLLFWDIIFESIPGAFETPYQTAPLDIAEDSFYHARKDLMENRLTAIEAGKGPELLRAVDTEHRASETWCVGVQWDLFSSEDLVDIVTCIGGKALSVICRVLCEDYAFGTSGGPDLFLWDTEKGTCKFVEVKGPGDSLRENQRIWIDILLKAPVPVEVCRIEESEDNEIGKKPNVRTPKSTHKKAKKTRRKEKEMLEDEDEDKGDEDALPNTLDESHTEEEQDLNDMHPSVDPVGHHATGAPSGMAITPSNPLKRKARPKRDLSPSPSKRKRVS